MRLSGVEIEAATGGIWHGLMPDNVTGISTDSRNFQAGNAFLALRGPNFDGHGFAVPLADKATALIGDRTGMRSWADLKISRLEVEDTLCALGDIAHAWRSKLTDTCVIAITGSYGKTSLRSLLETAFTALGLNVAATRANLNNLIGVPATLLAVPDDADVAVIECGISEGGEMARLAAMVQPDIAVLTGITAAHTAGLGGLAGVVREKSLLALAVKADSWCALGAGVATLMRASHIATPETWVVVDDTANSNVRNGDAVTWQLDGCDLSLDYQGQQSMIRLALPAAHWASNIAFAASIVLRFLRDRGDVADLTCVTKALRLWQPMTGRMQRRTGCTGLVVLDDCYNANPVSMQAAIDTLRALPGKKIAILADMAELGEGSQMAHAGLDVAGLDMLYLIGDEMRALAEIHPESRWFATTDDVLGELAGNTFTRGDTVLVKASRSMHLELVVELLCQEEVANAV